MDVWKYEIISRVEQDISLVDSWDILVNTRNKFHISAHPCIILYCIYTRLEMRTEEFFVPEIYTVSQVQVAYWVHCMYTFCVCVPHISRP